MILLSDNDCTVKKMRLTPFHSSTFSIFAAVLLPGCVSLEPIRLAGDAVAAKSEYALLWSAGTYVKGFETVNYADVRAVDGVALKEGTGYGVPIEIAPGRHTVEIDFQKDSLLCGWASCIKFYQASHQLQLWARAGHSYFPFTRKHCNNNWFWIVDTGNEAAADIATWKKSGSYGFIYAMRTSEKGKQTVVAGEEPPEKCEDYHEKN